VKEIKVPKPWGHEIIWAHTDKYVAKILFIKAGENLSLQYHDIKEETIRVLSGTLYLEQATDWGSSTERRWTETLQPGACFHVVPATIHRFSARETDVTLVEVSTPELFDVVRLEDSYGRKAQ
jgi:mannose-6-phosphate isomerase-like protein (cupin superfamily)